MLSKFKFLAPEKLMVHQIFGDDLGEVTDIQKLDRVIRITVYFMRTHGSVYTGGINPETLIIPLMFRLYKDKTQTYGYTQIVGKIRQIIMCVNHDETHLHVAKLVSEAWMSVDIEMETLLYLYHKLNWHEGF